MAGGNLIHLLGLIPARSGSNRVPDKNIRPFAGSDLLSRAVSEALRARCLDSVGLTTDSDAYRDVARRAGLDEAYLRPAELAGDEATASAAILHYVEWRSRRGGERPTHVVLLQPTNPFRNAALIDNAVLFWKDSGRPSLASVTPAAARARFVISKDRTTGNQVREGKDGTRDFFVLDGAIFITPIAMIRDTGRVWDEDSALYINTYPCPYDIDTEADFAAAKGLLKP